jgi:hypothetical protein
MRISSIHNKCSFNTLRIIDNISQCKIFITSFQKINNMKQLQKIQWLLILGLFWGLSLHAQETVPATGGMASGSGGTVSYSVGQLTWNTFTGVTGSSAQGVQQPYEISVVTGIGNIDGITLKCTVFPNPTKGLIKLLIESTDLKNFSFQLTEINGKLIQDKKVESRETGISMDNLVSGIYFLKVAYKKSEIKVFKIVKN